MKPMEILVRTQNTSLNPYRRKILTFPYLNFIRSGLSSQIIVIVTGNSLFNSSSLWFYSSISSLWFYSSISSLWFYSQINIRINLGINFLNFNLIGNHLIRNHLIRYYLLIFLRIRNRYQNNTNHKC